MFIAHASAMYERQVRILSNVWNTVFILSHMCHKVQYEMEMFVIRAQRGSQYTFSHWPARLYENKLSAGMKNDSLASIVHQ